MKFLKIFVLLSLVLITMQRVTKSETSNLKAKRKNSAKVKTSAKTSAKTSSKTSAKDVLQKPYGGDLSVDNSDSIVGFIRAYDLEYTQVKGIVIRTDNYVDIGDQKINSALVRTGKGIYYLPWRSISQVNFNSPWVGHDWIETSTKGKSVKFWFWFGSWDNGSGQDLTSRLNQFRNRRITYLREKMASLSTYAANYAVAKQGFDAANSKLPGVENQINQLQNDIDANSEKKYTYVAAANSFANQIVTEQTKLTTLRKQLSDLNNENAQKNALITKLKTSIDDLTKQKSADNISADGFKKQMDKSSSDFTATAAALKVEVVSDASKVDAASDALLKEASLEKCAQEIAKILP